MDESSLWQVKLAKSNINITSVQYNINHKACVVCFEFPYHPVPGKVKWFKTAEEFFNINLSDKDNLKKMMDNNELPLVWLHDLTPALLDRVLSLRKVLEG